MEAVITILLLNNGFDLRTIHYLHFTSQTRYSKITQSVDVLSARTCCPSELLGKVLVFGFRVGCEPPACSSHCSCLQTGLIVHQKVGA